MTSHHRRSDASNPILITLSVGGTSFSLKPTSNHNAGSMQFHQDETGEIILNLSGFSGTLKVAENSAVSVTPKSTGNSQPSKRKMMDDMSSSKKVREALRETDDASVASDQVAIDEDITEFKYLSNEKRNVYCQKGTSQSCSDHQQPSQDGTLLGQTQQSQFSDSEPIYDEEEAVTLASKILDSPSDAMPSLPTARVSLGDKEKQLESETSWLAPPAMSTKSHTSPCSRWGHTLTDIGLNRLLVYGGQTIDTETMKPTTLNDVMIYDTLRKTWFKPFSCNGSPRQWHTASFLAERQLLITFGGESIIKGKVITESKVMVLDTEIMLWYPPTVTGEVPSNRSGHTATVLGNDLVVFGGVKGRKWLNALSVLDCNSWKWMTVKTSGAAPPPRSYHSAVAIGESRICYFGGNNAEQCFDSVHVLERSIQGEWRWSHPTVSGCKPVARTGHSATVLADGVTVVVYGGWDPNCDDDDMSNDDESIFGDSYCLDTESWSWRKNGVASKRVGHASLLQKDTSQILVYGGRIPGDKFTCDFETVCIQTETVS